MLNKATGKEFFNTDTSIMTNPFNSESFQREMKPRVSMAHLALEYENVESSLFKVSAELSDKLGAEAYEEIITLGQAAGVSSVVNSEVKIHSEALDYLKRSILHFALYHHIIYTIANISNDGITVTKSDDKTTIYKYQQDQLEEQLLRDAWFWLNRLIGLLNDNLDLFPCWAAGDKHKELSDMPLSIGQLERYVGVSDATFLLYAGWIVREVWHEDVESRLHGESTDVPESVIRAVCYEVMARACRRLAFHALPSPIRIDINNEMGKNHAAQADTTIREKVAQIFADKALGYWKAADEDLHRSASQDAAHYPWHRRLTDKDKFVC